MKRIRMTESDLHRIIKSSVKKILKENDEGDYDWDVADDSTPSFYQRYADDNGYWSSKFGKEEAFNKRFPNGAPYNGSKQDQMDYDWKTLPQYNDYVNDPLMGDYDPSVREDFPNDKAFEMYNDWTRRDSKNYDFDRETPSLFRGDPDYEPQSDKMKQVDAAWREHGLNESRIKRIVRESLRKTLKQAK